MPRFTTISPTHVPGKKAYAWKNFCNGGYIATGWWHEDFTGKPIDEVISFIREQKSDNEAKAIDAFQKFFSLDVGDYVAVPNVQHGLFGVGVIRSGYKFELYKHDTGAADQSGFYSHYHYCPIKLF